MIRVCTFARQIPNAFVVNRCSTYLLGHPRTRISAAAANHVAAKQEASRVIADIIDSSLRGHGATSATSSGAVSDVFAQLLQLSGDAGAGNRIAAASAVASCTSLVCHHCDLLHKWAAVPRTALAENSSFTVAAPGANSAATLPDVLGCVVGSADGLINFSNFDLNRVLTHGNPLLAHGPDRYAIPVAAPSAQRLMLQRAEVLRVIGLESAAAAGVSGTASDRASAMAMTETSALNSNSGDIGSNVSAAMKVTDLGDTVSSHDLLSASSSSSSAVVQSSEEVLLPGRLTKKRRKGAAAGATSSSSMPTDSTAASGGGTAAASASVSVSDAAIKGSDSVAPASSPSQASAAPLESLELLYDDACYRLFDPCWETRHGAALILRGLLLGLHKICRSLPTRTVVASGFSSAATAAASSAVGVVSSSVGASVAEDLILRCTVVLALDKFADYGAGSVAGAGAGSALVSSSSASKGRNTSGSKLLAPAALSPAAAAPAPTIDSVPCPVREIVAQLLALAAAELPVQRVRTVAEALLSLASHDDWHVRHGCVLGLRATVSVLLQSDWLLPHNFAEAGAGAASASSSAAPASTDLLHVLVAVAKGVVPLITDSSEDVAALAGDVFSLLTQHGAASPHILLESKRLAVDGCLKQLKAVASDNSSASPIASSLLPLLDHLLLPLAAEADAQLATDIQQAAELASLFCESPVAIVRAASTNLLQRCADTARRGSNGDWWTARGMSVCLSAALRVVLLDVSVAATGDITAEDILLRHHNVALLFDGAEMGASSAGLLESTLMVDHGHTNAGPSNSSNSAVTTGHPSSPSLAPLFSSLLSVLRTQTGYVINVAPLRLADRHSPAPGNNAAASADCNMDTGGDDSPAAQSTAAMDPSSSRPMTFQHRLVGARAAAEILASGLIGGPSCSLMLLQAAREQALSAFFSSATGVVDMTALQAFALVFAELLRLRPSLSLKSALFASLPGLLARFSASEIPSPCGELMPFLRELATACADLHNARDTYKQLLAPASPAASGKGNGKGKKSTGKQRAHDEDADKHANSSDASMYLDMPHLHANAVNLVDATAVLLDETASGNTCGSGGSAPSQASKPLVSNDAKVLAFREEVRLQLGRVRGLMEKALQQWRMLQATTAACIAAASLAPSLPLHLVDAQLLPAKLTPPLRALLDAVAHSGNPAVEAFAGSAIAEVCALCCCSTSSSSSAGTPAGKVVDTRNLVEVASRMVAKVVGMLADAHAPVSTDVGSQNAQEQRMKLNRGAVIAVLRLLTSVENETCRVIIIGWLSMPPAAKPSASAQNSAATSSSLPSSSPEVVTSLRLLACFIASEVEMYQAHALELLPSAYQQLGCADVIVADAASLVLRTASAHAFHRFMEHAASDVLPAWNSTARQIRLAWFQALALCLDNKSVVVIRSGVVTSIHNALQLYGPVLIPLSIRTMVSTDADMRPAAAALFRCLVQSLPLTIAGKLVGTADGSGALSTEGWSDQLMQARQAGMAVVTTLSQGASAALWRLPPSIADTIVNGGASGAAAADTDNAAAPSSSAGRMSESAAATTIQSTSPTLLPGALPCGAELRPYQLEGIAWLDFLRHHGLGGVLADDMGLGKTIQVLTAMAVAVNEASSAGDGVGGAASAASSSHSQRLPPVSLVIAPTTVMHHWEGEMKRYYGGVVASDRGDNLVSVGASSTGAVGNGASAHGLHLKPIVYSGTPNERAKTLASLQPTSQGSDTFSAPHSHSHTVVITSYSILRRDVAALSTLEYAFCIYDEAHVASNPTSAIAAACVQIASKASHRFALTGTPISNSVVDIWSLFNLVLPGYLGTFDSFRKTTANAVARARNITATEADVNASRAALGTLHRQILPFVLRRMKGDVLTDLPPKTVQDVCVELTTAQKQLYAAFVQGPGAALARVAGAAGASSAGSVDDASVGINGGRADVLSSLQLLRQICNHPDLVSDEMRSALGLPVVGSAGSSRGGSKSATPAHQQHHGMSASCKLIALHELLVELGFGSSGSGRGSDDLSEGDNEEDANESSAGAAVGASGKRKRPAAASSAAMQSGPAARIFLKSHKVLIFAQTSKMLDCITTQLLRPHFPTLAAPGAGHARIDGSTTAADRVATANKFNSDLSLSLLMLTTAVGGLGLSLTGADTVIFIDHDWNPNRDLQAMDRAHRLGQSRAVNVYRLIAKDTLEERIMSLQKMKEHVARTVVSDSNANVASMGLEGGGAGVLGLLREQSSSSSGAALSSLVSDLAVGAAAAAYDAGIAGDEHDAGEDLDQLDLGSFLGLIKK